MIKVIVHTKVTDQLKTLLNTQAALVSGKRANAKGLLNRPTVNLVDLNPKSIVIIIS